MPIELVGRDRELALLAECLAEALAGRPRIVLYRGEPGIGKTRLSEELAALAAADGVPVAGAAGSRRTVPRRTGPGGRCCAPSPTTPTSRVSPRSSG